MIRPIFFLFLLFFYTTNIAQVSPVCDTPANGSDWQLIGPNSLPEPGPGARFSQLGTGAQMRIKLQDAHLPNPKIMYACTPTGGLFRTMDVTAETPVWENLTDNTRLPVLGVRDMAFVEGDDQTVYIGAGLRYPLELRRLYGIGVLKTKDGGKSWEKTGLQFTPRGTREQVCHNIIVDPENPATVHAICGGHYHKSTDGGETFTLKKIHELKSPAGWGASFRDLLFKPDNPQVLYLSTDHNFLFVSEDGGESWRTIDVRELGVGSETVRMDLAVSPAAPAVVYAACATKSGETILRSDDAGKNWKIVFEKRIKTSYERNDFVISPNDVNVLYIGGLYIDRIVIDSTKNNSRSISSGTHLDHRGLLVIDDGTGNDIVFSANDGGLYRGTQPDGKRNWDWKDLSGIGMNNTQFYGIGVAEDLSVFVGGTQDNGVLTGDSTGLFIKPRLGGDGADCAVDPFNSKRVYGSKWDLTPPQIWLSEDGGKDFKKHLRKGLEDSADTYYMQLEAAEDGNLYFGTRNIFKLPPNSDTWERIGDIQLPTDDPYRILSMAVCPTDPNVIYAVGDLLYKTTNATAADVKWEKISDGMGAAAIPYGAGGEMSAVTLDPNRPERVWVSIRNYQSDFKVYYSENGGETWTSVSKGLPPFPVNDIVFQAGTPDALYAGTDVGVFYNPNGSDPDSEWRCFNHGLPVCLVADLEMNYCYNTIVAGTFGRGIWTSPFAEPSSFSPIEMEENTDWNYKILRSDVTLKKGSTLLLRGEIRIASGRKIRLEKNSTLILDGANVDALCGEKWGGIEVVDEPNFFQRFFGARPGVVILKNNAAINNASLEIP